MKIKWFRKQSPELTEPHLVECIDEIRHCHSSFQRRPSYHGPRALDRLERIAGGLRARTPKEYGSDLMWCAVVTLQMYHQYISEWDFGMKYCKRRRKLMDSAFAVYSKLHWLLFRHDAEDLIQLLVQYILDVQLWKTVFICNRMLGEFEHDRSLVVKCVLSVVARGTAGPEAREVLLGVLKNPGTPLDADTVTLLMSTSYLASARGDRLLHHATTNCLRVPGGHVHVSRLTAAMFHVLEDESDQGNVAVLHALATLLESAMAVYDQKLYCFVLEHVFAALLDLVASKEADVSLLGCYMFQCMIDRHNNRKRFHYPRIFFVATTHTANLGQYNHDDKKFLARYRAQIHASFLAAVRQHCHSFEHLQNVYNCLALLIVEVPCDYTACAMTCVAMNMQTYTISNLDLDMAASHRLHATVIALVSLVCSVNRATRFSQYLLEVVAHRAYAAPFLNPPLRVRYQYAQHAVLWNKPELFFDHYEVRYCMWKCFRTQERKYPFRAIYKDEI